MIYLINKHDNFVHMFTFVENSRELFQELTSAHIHKLRRDNAVLDVYV